MDWRTKDTCDTKEERSQGQGEGGGTKHHLQGSVSPTKRVGLSGGTEAELHIGCLNGRGPSIFTTVGDVARHIWCRDFLFSWVKEGENLVL